MVDRVPERGDELDAPDWALVLRRLKAYRAAALQGEEDRRIKDRKGMKLARGQMWDDGIVAGRLPITANKAVALIDRLVSSITKNAPSPEIHAVNSDDDDAAALLQGALVTNWRTDDMQYKVKVGQRKAAFTRPILHYVFWDAQARDGLGDFSDRIIPAWRCVIDDRFMRVRDMEFVGFTETMTRAKLTMLFPDKAEAIEEAGQSRGENRLPTPGGGADPERLSGTQGAPTVDRLVADSPMGPFVGKTTLRIGQARKGRPRDPLTEEVDVEFLWWDDPSTITTQRPRKNALGQTVMKLVRHEDSDEIVMDHAGHDVVDTPLGPLFVPQVKPRLEPVMEPHVEKKYPKRRHTARIIGDDVCLWDVKWDGPTPLYTQRDTYALVGYWSEGKALRVASLGIARNLLLTIIMERLKLSMGGTYFASMRSGLKRNKLTPESGVVWQVNDVNEIKPVPVNPIDAAYFNLLNVFEAEMEGLLGLAPVMQGQAAGRADSPATYDKLIEAGGVQIVDDAQLVEMAVQDWARIAMWYVQTRYTHEHYVEVDQEDGTVDYRVCSALATKGDYSVRVETGSMVAYSESVRFERAKEAAALGFYALPRLGREAHIPHWRRALEERRNILADPGKAYLLGPSGATPQQQSKVVQTQGRRSHHAPGR